MIPGALSCQCGLTLTEEQLWSGNCPRCTQLVKKAKAIALMCFDLDCYRPAVSKGLCRRHYMQQLRRRKAS